jgi:hypothetical protein
MTPTEFLRELRRSKDDGCLVTVDSVIDAMDRWTDPTFHGDEGMIVALLRGQIRNAPSRRRTGTHAFNGAGHE